ncbi:hypothetical protein C8J56DRAFT_1043388 [Mycena floridula]|nr:hypothetical protein C8J56DRAFT_1043388 [Mycena floridula]
MTSQLDTFPDIPDDIIRLIFEAAVQADRSTARNLVLVARHVQKWIQPLQFKSVRLRDEQKAETFLQEVTSNPTRLGIHVQTMTLSDLGAGLRKDIVNSLPHLSALTTLLHPEEIRSFFSSRPPSLKQMSLTLRWDPNRTLHQDVIPFPPESLTHLELVGGIDYPFIPDEGLKRLSRLTHLIVRYDWVANGHICVFVEELLLHLPNSLQQIIIFIVNVNPLVSSFVRIPGLTFSWIIERCDPRVVFVMGAADERIGPIDPRVIECILFDTLMPPGVWCSSPSGYTDIWDRATANQFQAPVLFELSAMHLEGFKEIEVRKKTARYSEGRGGKLGGKQQSWRLAAYRD